MDCTHAESTAYIFAGNAALAGGWTGELRRCDCGVWLTDGGVELDTDECDALGIDPTGR